MSSSASASAGYSSLATAEFLVRLESKSARVKGLAFHPRRPWVLASLHTGEIQLWDYVMHAMIEQFVEYECPVRSVDFHPSQPLFVSGGDDGRVIVWNYRKRKSEFPLLGHSDYVRTVQFHREHPWIVSAGDDQLIRIWNWQSRSCISVLGGHNNYVMSALFHPDPSQPLLVSASMDYTVRVWDLTGLKSRTSGPGMDGGMSQTIGGSNTGADIFGNNDAVVKYVLEGHERGVNWAVFHPTQPLIVSCGDDRTIRVWRVDDARAWELDIMRGHMDNVSTVAFMPQYDAVVSNGEDHCIRVWDLSRRSPLATFRKDRDRYWALAMHPTCGLVAAGHDSGFTVFKLAHERPCYALNEANQTIYFIRDKVYRGFNLGTSRETSIVAQRRVDRWVVPSQHDRALLSWSTSDGGSYTLFVLPGDRQQPGESDVVRGLALSVCFCGRQRIALLDRSGHIVLRMFSGDLVRRIASPVSNATQVFAAPAGNILVRNDESVALYDPSRMRVLATLDVPGVKHVYWSPDNSRVALCSSSCVVLANRNLSTLATSVEHLHVKSGLWMDSGVFLFNTPHNLKYIMVQGDVGVLCSLSGTIYMAAVVKNEIVLVSRTGELSRMPLNDTEIRFKKALYDHRFEDVLKIVRTEALAGESVVAFLQQKGFPEVALHLVTDEALRLQLAIECGNLDVALEAAKALDTPESWTKLGDAALAQGNVSVMEMTLQRSKAFERLGFLYAITGNTDKSRKMLTVAQKRQDPSARFHNALLVGDARERVNVLLEAGMLPLAYACAARHGMHEKAAEIAELLGGQVPALPKGDGELLLPPTPVLREGNWPLLSVQRSLMSNALKKGGTAFDADAGAAATADAVGGWGADDDDGAAGADGDAGDGAAWGEVDDGAAGAGLADGEEAGAGGWDMDDLDGTSPGMGAAPKGVLLDSAPTQGEPVTGKWLSQGTVADAVAAGDFASAARMLHSMAGVVDISPLRAAFLAHAMAARASLPLLPGTPQVVSYLGGVTPPATVSLEALIERLKTQAYKKVTDGVFESAVATFRSIVHDSLLVVVESRTDEDDVNELLDICRRYIVGISCELARKKATDAVRQLELASYFTHCDLQPAHQLLTLRSAMIAAAKVEHHAIAAAHARRALDCNPPAQVAQRARQIIAAADQAAGKPAPKINYDPRNPFQLNAHTLMPMYHGSTVVRCGLCRAAYSPAENGQTCPVCLVAQIGAQASGMRWRRLGSSSR